MLRLLGYLSINAEVDLIVEVVVDEDITLDVVVAAEVVVIIARRTTRAINSATVAISNVKVVTNVMADIRTEM